jgi:predicted nucleic acid-binding Zn finger protein
MQFSYSSIPLELAWKGKKLCLSRIGVRTFAMANKILIKIALAYSEFPNVIRRLYEEGKLGSQNK